MRFLIAVLFLLPLSAHAQDMTALTDMEGRYTLGAWVGSQLGKTCQLSNDEPLAGASLVISGKQGTQELHASVGGDAVTLDFESLKKQKFLTIEDHSYDLHGFADALALLKGCLETKTLELPDEPLDESDAVSVGAWSVTTLSAKSYVYAKLATLQDSRKPVLGVWHYADRFFLTLSGIQVDDREVVLALDGGATLALSAWPQEDGALIPLTSEHVKQLESSAHLTIFSQTYDFTGFKAVIAALQEMK